MNRRSFIQHLPSIGAALALPCVVKAENNFANPAPDAAGFTKSGAGFYPKTYLKNCYIQPRHDEHVQMFIVENDTVFATLDSYAIIPKEEYYKLTGFTEPISK